MYGGITGNALPSFPPFPLQTPALYLPGGFHIEGVTLSNPSGFIEPSYDPEFGDTRPVAFSHGTQSFSDFNLESFADGDMAYIGYATSDFSMFGYMQIERVNVLDWKLIGYAYDPSGASILVTNLVPAPSMLGLAAASLLALPRRRISK